MPTQPDPIDALPDEVPSRSDPDNFPAEGDEFLGRLPDFQDQATALGTITYNNAVEAFNSASAAASSEQAAEESRLIAEGFSNYQGDYNPSTDYPTGQSVSYTDGFRYISKTTPNTGNQPDISPTNWFRAPKAFGGGGAVDSGSVALTSTSDTVQKITTTDYSQSVKLPDATTMAEGALVFMLQNAGNYDLAIYDSADSLLGFVFPKETVSVGLADNTTSAGNWVLGNAGSVGVVASTDSVGSATMSQAVEIDSDRSMMLFTDNDGLKAAIADAAGFGSSYLIRSGNPFVRAFLIDSSNVLVVTCSSTAFEAVLLTISGKDVTVNTADSETLAGNMSALRQVIECNGSYVVSYTRQSSVVAIRAITVSGTTVTIGSEATLSGTGGGKIHDYNDVLLALSDNGSNTLYARPFDVSGTTLTPGTEDSDSTAGVFRNSIAFGTGRIGVISTNSSTYASVVSVSALTATISRDILYSGQTMFGPEMLLLDTDKIFVSGSGSTLGIFNSFTDDAGTATPGTAVTTFGQATYGIVGIAGDYLMVQGFNNATTVQAVVYTSMDVSGASPILFRNQQTQTYTFSTETTANYQDGFSGDRRFVLSSVDSLIVPTKKGVDSFVYKSTIFDDGDFSVQEVKVGPISTGSNPVYGMNNSNIFMLEDQKTIRYVRAVL